MLWDFHDIFHNVYFRFVSIWEQTCIRRNLTDVYSLFVYKAKCSLLSQSSKIYVDWQIISKTWLELKLVCFFFFNNNDFYLFCNLFIWMSKCCPDNYMHPPAGRLASPPPTSLSWQPLFYSLFLKRYFKMFYK